MISTGEVRVGGLSKQVKNGDYWGYYMAESVIDRLVDLPLRK